MDTMAQVLHTASQEGFMRTLVDEGPAAAALVRRYAQAGPARHSDAVDPIQADHLDRLLRAIGPAPVVPEPAGATMPADLLTSKEIRVLELLAEGCSNSLMAQRLFVSDSTVRTHLRNLNQKLGASSRTHAVAIARRNGWVH